MQGIMHLYIDNASTYIQNRSTPSRTPTISRVEFEFRILTQLDFSTLDTEYKLAWMSAILIGDMFESFWVSQKYSHALSEPQIQRYRTDQSLCSYVAPPIPLPKQLASSPPKSVSFKNPPVDRKRSASYDPYDKADARNSFTELIDLDLGPTEVPGSRKRKKTEKAIANGRDEWETMAKGKKKASAAVKKKPRVNAPAAMQVSMPVVTEVSNPAGTDGISLATAEQNGHGAEKLGLNVVGDVQDVIVL